MSDLQRTPPSGGSAGDRDPGHPLAESGTTSVRAVMRLEYGSPIDVVTLGDLPIGRPAPGEVLIAVEAAAVNPLDWHFATGTPYLLRLTAGVRRPKRSALGADVAGVVVAVGDGVTQPAVGDRVAGTASGSFAELAIARAARLALIPDGVTFSEAAAVPVAGITALQAVRDHGAVRPGDRVLVNGASGGVGTFAVQLAVAVGAEVTGVCSGRNVELVRSLGASEVVDYETADWLDDAAYDVIIDNVGNRPLAACRAALVPGGRFVMVSGPKRNQWLDPFRRMIAGRLRFLGRGKRFGVVVADETGADLSELFGQLVGGRVRPVIDRHVALPDVPAAIDEIGRGHVPGKIVVEIGGSSSS